jgi:hypothetical protein
MHGLTLRRLGSARSVCILLVGASLALAWAGASLAEGDSVELLKWGHDNPGNLAYFRMFSTIDVKDKKAESWVDIGLPGADGVYQWAVTVPEKGELWVSVSAFSKFGLESDRTPWRHYTWDPTRGQLRAPGRAKLIE